MATAAVLALGLGLSACGSSPSDGDSDSADGDDASSDDGTSSAAPIPLEELCPVFTRDLCQYLIECSGVEYRSIDDCVAEQDCYGLGELEASAARGAVDYHPETVGSCHETFSEDPCNFGAFLFTPDIYEVLSFCPGTLTARLEAGAECVSDGECVEGLYCYKPDYQCPGSCEAPRPIGDACPSGARCAEGARCDADVCIARAQPGDSCADVGCSYSLTCKDGEICNGNLWCNASDVCEVGRGLDEPCGRIDDVSAECAIGLYCDSATPFEQGTCKRPGSEGDACNTDLDACTDGLQCLGAEITPTPVLGQCSGPSPVNGPCSRYHGCQEGLVCVDSLCVERLGVGGSCGFLNGTCAEGLICRGSECAEPIYFGDSCSDSAPCDFGRCVDGKCAPSLRVGEPCESNADCSSNHCIAGACYDSSVCNAPDD